MTDKEKQALLDALASWRMTVDSMLTLPVGAYDRMALRHHAIAENSASEDAIALEAYQARFSR